MQTNEWDALGSMLGGVGAVIAVGLAWWVAYREAERWRWQAVSVKRADVAGRVMEATLSALDALKYASSARVDSSERTQLANQFSQRWADIAEYLRELHRAEGLAAVFLEEASQQVVADVGKLQRSILSAQQTWLQPGTFGAHPEVTKPFVSEGIGPDVGKKIAALENQVRAVIGPTARLEKGR